MGDIVHPRRRYLSRELEARAEEDESDSSMWLGIRRAYPGTDFPVGFPAQAALTVARYEKLEDVIGADADELETQGLTAAEAKAVIAAIAEL